MGLSRLDSNKYDSIRKAKLKMSFNPSADGPSILNSHRSVNEYGETEIKQIRQQQKRFSDVEISEIAQEYRSGKTTYELAEQYGCARHTIVTALKKMGIMATKAKAQEALDADEVIRLYNEYHTIEEIAKKHGVSSNAINRCLRYNGVAIRGRWDYPK